MKNILSFFKKGLIYFDSQNKKNMEKVEQKIKALNERKEPEPKINKVVDNNVNPNYNEQKERINELEKQLNQLNKK